jgi:hypothetical protein
MATQESERSFADTIASMYNAVMRGGEIQGAFRQGIAELGAALKAFPDSIQIDEPGALFSPLHSDIAAANRSYGVGPANDRMPTPSQIADGHSSATVHGESKSLPTPSQIADERPQPGPEQQNGQEHGHDHGRGR